MNEDEKEIMDEINRYVHGLWKFYEKNKLFSPLGFSIVSTFLVRLTLDSGMPLERGCGAFDRVKATYEEAKKELDKMMVENEVAR